MILLKMLGSIDLASALAFLLLTFGIGVYFQYLLFCAGLLLLKGLFVLTGDILSVIDIISAVLLLLSIFLTLPTIIIWIPIFLLTAKGLLSFI